MENDRPIAAATGPFETFYEKLKAVLVADCRRFNDDALRGQSWSDPEGEMVGSIVEAARMMETGTRHMRMVCTCIELLDKEMGGHP